MSAFRRASSADGRPAGASTPSQVVDTALSIAGEIAQKSPGGVRLMKEVINLTEPLGLNDGYHVETFATAIISAHTDSKESARAFREKRPAVYKPA